MRPNTDRQMFILHVRPRTYGDPRGIDRHERCAIRVFCPGDLKIIPGIKHQLILHRMVYGLGVGRAGFLAKTAPVALSEIDRIVLNDFFTRGISLAFKRDAGRGTSAHAHVAGDAFFDMECQHATKALGHRRFLFGELNRDFGLEHISERQGEAAQKRRRIIPNVLKVGNHRGIILYGT